jgi:hypothetical protein
VCTNPSNYTGGDAGSWYPQGYDFYGVGGGEVVGAVIFEY